MTPAAQIAAAAEVLDRVLAGESAERALTGWARGSRFAGSRDRAAVRDLVFDALRCRRSYAARGGAGTGRGLMLGALRAAGRDPDALFTGDGHAPAPLTPAERAAGGAPTAGPETLDCPDWLFPVLDAALAPDTAAVLQALQRRAPVHLRVNLRRSSREAVRAALGDRGIATVPHALSPAALEVVSGARGVKADPAYLGGTVELQDAASQAVADMVPLEPGGQMLDYCAGGGGKTLAVGGRVAGRFVAHDAHPRRMADLPARAARAGLDVRCVTTAALRALGRFDAVLCDAPCSGSGSWRRDPEGKWTLTSARLDEVVALQARILAEAAPLVAPGGALIYATCSLIDAENRDQVTTFLARHPDFAAGLQRRFTPLDGGDGFFAAVLTRR